MEKFIPILFIFLLLTGCTAQENIENSAESQQVSAQEEIELIKYDAKLYDAEVFIDGAAWVGYINPNTNERGLAILKTDGLLIPQNIYGHRNGQGLPLFSKGYSYMNYWDEEKGCMQFYIVNDIGEMVYCSPSDDGYEILTGGDGVYLVKKKVSNMYEEKECYGFIDTNGEWIQDPDSEHPIQNIDNKIIDSTYLGEGIFAAKYSGENSYLRLYNPKTGMFSEKANMNIDEEFYNGYTVAYPDEYSDEGIYRVSIDGQFDYMMEMPYGKHAPVEYGENILYTGNEVASAAFYDLNGTVLFNLSTQYQLQSLEEGYHFKNNHAVVQILGADNEEYLGIIDKKGEFLFEPVKLVNKYAFDATGRFSEDVIACSIDGVGPAILTIQGDIIPIKSDNIDEIFFSDGYAVNKNGEYYEMIGKDGQALDMYIKE